MKWLKSIFSRPNTIEVPEGSINSVIDDATNKLRYKTAINIDKSKTDIIKSKQAIKLIFEDENVRIFIEKLKGVIENE